MLVVVAILFFVSQICDKFKTFLEFNFLPRKPRMINRGKWCNTMTGFNSREDAFVLLPFIRLYGKIYLSFDKT